MSKCACMSSIKNADERSSKDCVCGGHNHKNVKKNKHHHGTRVKYYRRLVRRFVSAFIKGR